MGSLNRKEKRDWRGSKTGLKEKQGSQLIETLEKWKNKLNSKRQFQGRYLLGLGVQKRRDSGRRNVGDGGMKGVREHKGFSSRN